MIVNEERKVIPFRYYPQELDPDLAELFRIQGWGKSINKALTHAVRIAAAYIRNGDAITKAGKKAGSLRDRDEVMGELSKALGVEIR